MMSKSELEEALLYQMRIKGIAEPKQEYRFHDTRKWRFDFAWIEIKLACEVEGGIWSGGRHTQGTGYENDCDKYNTAVCSGWNVLRVTGSMIKDGRAIQYIEQGLERCG